MLNSETAAPVQRRRRSLVEAEASAPVAKPVPEATPAPKGLVFECKVTKEVLANALSRVTGVVEQRNTIPILAHVKIDFIRAGIANDNRHGLERLRRRKSRSNCSGASIRRRGSGP